MNAPVSSDYVNISLQFLNLEWGHFSDISSLYLNHPYMDYEVVGNMYKFSVPKE